jgi:hypothetical protein
MNEERVCQILADIKATMNELNSTLVKHLSEHKDDEVVKEAVEAMSHFNLPDRLDQTL